MRHRKGIVLGLVALAFALAGTGCYDDDGFFLPDLQLTLSGQVTNQVTGGPIEGARVEVDGRHDFTDLDGHYRVEELRRGVFRVQVTRSGYESLARDVELDDVVEFEDFALRRL